MKDRSGVSEAARSLSSKVVRDRRDPKWVKLVSSRQVKVGNSYAIVGLAAEDTVTALAQG